METDPFWQSGAEVVFSGPDVPGEGEHKVMDMIRLEQEKGKGNKNQFRHCMYGLDADLIMLSLVTHEPFFVLLREKISKRKQNKDAMSYSPEDFELLQNDDESPNQSSYSQDVSLLSNEHIRDFFYDDDSLEGDDIITIFLENFMKKDTWADAFVISQAAVYLNVIFLLLVEKKGRVEDYAIFDMQAQLEHPIDKDTQFILASYQPQKHFKLIVQEPYVGKFTIDTLPQVIKDKFPLFKSAAEATDEAPTYEPVAVDVPKIPDVVAPSKYTAEALKGKTLKELEDILKSEFPDVPQSRVKKENGKQGLIDCILNPEEEKCKKLTKKKATGGRATRRV
jgi:hypothetical protein